LRLDGAVAEYNDVVVDLLPRLLLLLLLLLLVELKTFADARQFLHFINLYVNTCSPQLSD